ncbi:S-layer homology domain-containing protein [Leptolyngbya sp. AN03gr2]|uniref:S-layer homology domain-containing protein n=1 Tax=unclassified Leptolyngbya TaxID=2650499 RepID=UPI003D3135B5
MTDITSVSQLKDVNPTDCYFEDLKSLIEDYGISVGNPDGTFRPNEPLSRAEAVSLLNRGLDRLNEVIAASAADSEKLLSELIAASVADSEDRLKELIAASKAA